MYTEVQGEKRHIIGGLRKLSSLSLEQKTLSADMISLLMCETTCFCLPLKMMVINYLLC